MRYAANSNLSVGWVESSLAVLVVLGVGCGGEEDSNPPQFGEPTITCEDLQDDDIDQPVVREVSVEVTDPDRDLTTRGSQLCGTFNGLPIALGDPDADKVFTWTPSKELSDNPCDGAIDVSDNRMICDGSFRLTVTATDAAGNTAELDTEIQKGSSS